LSDGELRTLFREHLRSVHWTSIETGLINPGVPDAYGAADGRMFWVEHKRTDGWAVTLEVSQVGWHTAHARHGGTSYVAVRRRHSGGPRRGPAVDELWVLWGGQAARARDLGLRGCASGELALLHRSAGGPARWDWAAVLAVLTRSSC